MNAALQVPDQKSAIGMPDSSIAELIRMGTGMLTEAQIEQPRHTAGLLLQWVLRVEQVYLLTNPQQWVMDAHRSRYLSAVERRAQGAPLQYITERQEFYSLEFEVSPAVLIPRPETELIVEAVLEHNDRETPSIIDVGTGSGCLAVALAKLMPAARLVALDVSAEALAMAERNASRHGVADRIRFLQSDLFSELTPPSRADLIVSNPPYISESEWETLMREVRDYEPRGALVSGAVPHAVQERIFEDAPAHLRENGILICELGAGQYPEILRLVDEHTYSVVEVKKDFQGIPRTLILRRGT